MTEPASEIRLSYIRMVVKATGAASKYQKSPEEIDSDARLAVKRFAHIATEDLREMFEYGQELQASTIDEFIALWNIKIEEREREAQIARRRKKAEDEQLRLTSPHPNRDATFRAWGFIS